MKPDFERIKATTDIVRVIEGYGVALKKTGQDHVGLCPFHDDKKPSLHVTPAKGLFHCPACSVPANYHPLRPAIPRCIPISLTA